MRKNEVKLRHTLTHTCVKIVFQQQKQQQQQQIKSPNVQAAKTKQNLKDGNKIKRAENGERERLAQVEVAK